MAEIIRLTKKCYEEFKKLQNELLADKQKESEDAKITDSEVVCKIIRHYKKSMAVIEK